MKPEDIVKAVMLSVVVSVITTFVLEEIRARRKGQNNET